MDRVQRISRRLMPVLWPSFVAAGLLDMMTFAVLDPDGMFWPGGVPFDWSRQAVYTVTFFLYWAVIAASSAITLRLYARWH